MNTVTIEEIAKELGIKSRELIARIDKLSPEALFSLNIKSGKSIITVEIAETIFDAVMGDKDLAGIGDKPIHHRIGEINLSFVHTPLDIEFIKNFAAIYKTQSTEHFMVRSFNFSEMDIVRFFTAGLIGIDVARYINNRLAKEDVKRLLANLNEILDDVEVEGIDEEDPLNNLKTYIIKHKPEVIYIEGIDYKNVKKYRDVFQYITEVSKLSNIKFEMSFVNLPLNNTDKIIEKIVSDFRK